MPNRLATSTSPYLQQHANNPIDWFEWSDEAWEKARKEDKPVFISVGYSSCHWCHVMAHESFEDEEIARILNEHFVCIKVDREEHPDVDEAYMLAVQMMSRRGGWPMSVFANHDRTPFFAATYFPKEDRGEFPGFKSVLFSIQKIWREKRAEIGALGKQIEGAVRQAYSRDGSSTLSTLPFDLIRDCFNAQRADFDPTNGGFGPAPKFPAHSSLAFLLDFASQADEDQAADALGMSFATLQKMALGGIHDHVGGGFSRYSTDEKWLLPHFEKMLYDNALLLRNYALAAQLARAISADPTADLFERAQIGILNWLKDEMTDSSGLFYSAIDADSEGEEGLFYLWSEAEIRSVLPEADAFIQAFGITPEGNYLDEATQRRTGLNILHLEEDRAEEFRQELQALKQARQQRERPMTDHKALASWNGLMIVGLVESGDLMTAERCAQAWLDAESKAGYLPHQVTAGVAGGPAYLEDYAALSLGMINLAASTQNAKWHQAADRLANEMTARFADEKGGFFSTSDEHDNIFGKNKPAYDQPIPSGNALAIQALLMLARMEEAEKHLMAVIGFAQKAPNAAEGLVHALLIYQMLSQAAPGVAPVSELQPAAAQKAPLEKVKVGLSSRELRAEGGEAKGVLKIIVPEGLHLNTNRPPARWLIPTEARMEPFSARFEFPEGSNERYEGVIEVPFTAKNVGSGGEFEITVSFQACTETECQERDELRIDGVIL